MFFCRCSYIWMERKLIPDRSANSSWVKLHSSRWRFSRVGNEAAERASSHSPACSSAKTLAGLTSPTSLTQRTRRTWKAAFSGA